MPMLPTGAHPVHGAEQPLPHNVALYRGTDVVNQLYYMFTKVLVTSIVHTYIHAYIHKANDNNYVQYILSCMERNTAFKWLEKCADNGINTCRLRNQYMVWGVALQLNYKYVKQWSL